MSEFKITAEEIAIIIHNITSKVPRPDGSHVGYWNDLTDSQKQNAINAVKKIMSEPAKTAEELHDLWMLPLLDDGWIAGDFSIEKKQHPCIVPFDRLPDTEVLKDELWSVLTEAFRRFYRED